jgi:glutamate/tyrosine decarboxylase-like PLP-dependent enzyme
MKANPVMEARPPAIAGETDVELDSTLKEWPRVPDEESLDPTDWAKFRELAHVTLDHCIDFISSVRDRPVWQPVSDETKLIFKKPVPYNPTTLEEVLDECRKWILPYSTGNIHPRFFGWVHGAGTPVGIISEMLAATMNSNCGGRDHGAIYVERQVIEWCREIFGFPEGVSGILTVGSSVASVIAISAARSRRLGPLVREKGNSDSGLVGYCSSEVHAALKKSFELLGLGKEHLRAIPTKVDFAIPIERLAASITADRAAGLQPFLLVGTAGTVNTGAYDDLRGLAELASRENLWFHVDGAFGAWARIADQPWRNLVQGIEQADSLTFDFHKWISVPYDAGCVLIRDAGAHRAAFAERPDYLAPGLRGLAAGDPWPSDYGIDLSRGFRALKVWMALHHYGIRELGRMITKNCQMASYLGDIVKRSDLFELAAPVSLNICCFSTKRRSMHDRDDRLIAQLVEQLQLSGIVAPSTARIKNRLCIRVAIVNHRTCREDLDILIKTAEENLRELAVESSAR